MVFAAGVCSEETGLEELAMRRYTISLLFEFFKQRGRDLKVPDYGRMLVRIFRHVHKNIAEKWSQEGLELDLAVVIASSATAYAARSGGGEMFLFHDGEARSVFGQSGGEPGLLGSDSGEDVQVEEIRLQPGDIAVLCDPVVAGVIGPRDMTLILRRAADPAKASLFLSAIAERKGAEAPFTALIWVVPNYQGAALLIGETPTLEPSQSGDEGYGEGEIEAAAPGEEEPADLVKKQWLNKWRRRKE